ncbi:LPXTG-site transpeptidase (sortase) family protein [Halobacillus alkaliphilus]|uniref:LPXTG-site transpeptidase (Sortase) family protein n=1 Tax=Halobacillus alkaliphilus TaxID=396056 RepID=A0A1I2LE88_9BACI|nr:class F sortase [Halobacillus alkaliphilus]SFF76800.1 LPXTG-site transpeptidase (sortase) family protein [Halobacillus alkaliphilus]
MEMKWKIYFTVVGIVALLMVGYETNVWANLTSSESETQVKRIENPEVDASDITPPEEKLKEQVAGGEFTVINKNKDMNSSEVVKEEKQKETGIVPANIQIPAIDVNSDIESVGVLDNGQMGVPEDPDKAGWFEPGTEPGNTGNSVIAGHVDSRTGPAVFYDLDKLEKGDEITVTDQNGEKKTYVVQKLESYPEKESPIGRIFGPTDEKRLNLITCTGEFVRYQGGHQDRLVVYSTLKEAEKEKSDIKAPTNIEVNGSLVTWYAVRKDYVAGYRVYRSKDGEEFEKVASISNHERKAYSDPEAAQYKYYVTTVALEGNESEPSKTVSFK